MGMGFLSFLACFLLILVLGSVEGGNATPELRGTIAFATVGRVNYGFDVYTIALPASLNDAKDVANHPLFEERRLTDGKSVNHNGYFTNHMGYDMLAFVSEREGSVKIYFELLQHGSQPSGKIIQSCSSNFMILLGGDGDSWSSGHGLVIGKSCD